MRGFGDPTEDELAGPASETYLKSPNTETLARIFLETTGLHKLVPVSSESTKRVTRSFLESNKY